MEQPSSGHYRGAATERLPGLASLTSLPEGRPPSGTGCLMDGLPAGGTAGGPRACPLTPERRPGRPEALGGAAQPAPGRLDMGIGGNLRQNLRRNLRQNLRRNLRRNLRQNLALLGRAALPWVR